MPETSDEQEIRIGPDDWHAHRQLVDCPQIVVGGPGTGKTEFLVARIVSAIATGSVHPSRILVLGFSRQGVKDIRSRLFSRLETISFRINVATYHSLAIRIVEAHAADLGWSAPPTILAGSEQEHFVARLLEREDTSLWPASYRSILTTPEMAAEITDFILRCHEHLLGPADIAAFKRDQWRELPDFFERYLARQVELGRTDYGRVLADAVQAVKTLPSLSTRYDLVVADEYQDTSPAQARLLMGLASGTHDLVVAADPYQSIYSFRGTDLHNVFSFPDDTKAALGKRAERLILTTSFRVPTEILAAAVSVTDRELPGGAGKVLSTRTGGSVASHVFSALADEADWIASDIERIHLADGVPLEGIAVLVRSGSALTDELADALGRRFIAHTHDESLLADEPIVTFVRNLVQAVSGSDTAVQRLVQSPYVGVSIGAMRAMALRHTNGETWPDILRSSLDDGDALAALFENTAWATTDAAPTGLWHLWSSLPHLVPIALDERRIDDRRAWTAFAQALDQVHARSPGSTLVDHEELVSRSDFEADPLFDFRRAGDRGVTMSTLHKAKGTSFDVVYIANAVEGALPDLRTNDSLLGARHLNPNVPADHAAYREFRLDEERRLAYTAMTRATTRVVWTATVSSDDGGQRASRFLSLVAQISDPPRSSSPLTHRSFEAALRRTLEDPTETAVERIAAAVVLSNGNTLGLSNPLHRYRINKVGPAKGLVPSDLRMSPSQANGYETCPRQYALGKYLLTSKAENVNMRFGTLIHSVLDQVEKAAIEAGRERANAEEAVQVLDTVWEELGFGEDAVGKAWHRKAEGMLGDMYRLWPTSARPIALETNLEITIEGTQWLGRVDRVEEKGSDITIVDYKTGAPVSVPEAAASIQLGYYVMAATEQPEITAHGEVSGAQFWFPKVLKKAAITTRDFNMENLEDVRDRMVEITNNIRAEALDPTVNRGCDTCEVELVCPARALGAEAFAT